MAWLAVYIVWFPQLSSHFFNFIPDNGMSMQKGFMLKNSFSCVSKGRLYTLLRFYPFSHLAVLSLHLGSAARLSLAVGKHLQTQASLLTQSSEEWDS